VIAMDLDALRAKYPHLGFAVYAYDPKGPVTLECITAEGKTFQFQGPTLAEAIAIGFAETDIPVSADTSVFD
jgi:hypothetical protein